MVRQHNNGLIHTAVLAIILCATIEAAGCADGEPALLHDAGPDGREADDGALSPASGPMGVPLGPAGQPVALGAQLSRVGRPGTMQVALLGLGRAAEAKYSLAAEYQRATPESASMFLPELVAMLATLDSLDSTCGNQWLSSPMAPRYVRLAEVLLDDRIYTDMAKRNCGVYMGLELEALGVIGKNSGQCGGRTFTQDTIERLYSLTIAGALSGWDDGVRLDTRVPTSTVDFPFIGKPNF